MRESVEKKKTRAKRVLALLQKAHPDAGIALKYKNPMQCLAAVILSAQCTDVRVNRVVKPLFKKYKTPKDFAQADMETFKQEIRSTGYYNAKAKNIISSAQRIVSDFNGRVPDTMEELLTLPGVARKTANVVLQNIHNTTVGVVVDTHVMRLSQRLGFSSEKDPVKVERDLMALFPKQKWKSLSDTLIFHGRRVCNARKPDCANCTVNKLCPSAFKV